MNDNDTKIQLPDLLMYVIFSIDEKIKCEDLAALDSKAIEKLSDIVNWISSDMKTMAGIGLSEVLIRCPDYDQFFAVYIADFFVLNLKFGNTHGVIESFGLFQNRMNSLHHEFIQSIKYYGFIKKANKIIYYPNPNSVGGESHRHFLMEYAKKWTNTSETIQKRMIIQAPHLEQEEIKEFSVIAWVGSPDCMETYEPEVGTLNLHFSSTLSEISKYFNTVLLEHGK